MPTTVTALPRVASDHMPIFLKRGEGIRDVDPFPFKFQNMWLKHPGFVELMHGW